MNGNDLIVGVVLSAMGGVLAVGSLVRYEWIAQMPKAKLLEASLGPANTRIALFALGTGILLLGLATATGWMKRPHRKTTLTPRCRNEGRILSF